MGIGYAFGLQEALDQIGAFLGPMIFTAVFYFSGKNGINEYQTGYRTLIVPYVFLMLLVTYVYFHVTRNGLIPEERKGEQNEDLQAVFWLYTVFTFFCTLGFVNFSTIGNHLKNKEVVPDAQITTLYAVAMIVDAVTALIVGKMYDRFKARSGKKAGGLEVLMALPLFTLALPLLSISSSVVSVWIGMILFGVIYGMHETVMRSAIADVTPYRKRGLAYGIFNSGYGLALLCGSALMGVLYDKGDVRLIVALTFVCELIAIALFLRMRKMLRVSGD